MWAPVRATSPVAVNPSGVHHVLVNGDLDGVERKPLGVGQGRPTEDELPADVGAEQANLAGGGEPVVEFEVAAGSELLGGQARGGGSRAAAPRAPAPRLESPGRRTSSPRSSSGQRSSVASRSSWPTSGRRPAATPAVGAAPPCLSEQLDQQFCGNATLDVPAGAICLGSSAVALPVRHVDHPPGPGLPRATPVPRPCGWCPPAPFALPNLVATHSLRMSATTGSLACRAGGAVTRTCVAEPERCEDPGDPSQAPARS